MSKFFSSRFKGLSAYTPGEQPKTGGFVKLNTNESPFPPSKEAVAEASKIANELNLYPDPTCSELTKALAEKLGVDKSQVLLGNGSDEILYFAFSAFCDKTKGVAFPSISYGFYEVFAEVLCLDYLKIPPKSDWSIDINDYMGLGRTIFIANPNAPTGLALSLAEVEKIVKGNPDSVVVIDEAYVDFGAESAVKLINKYDNLLVVQTFSKSRSMAGARLGMGIASKELINDLNTIKYSFNPYNINKMTLAAGLATVKDSEYTDNCCKEIMKVRSYTAEKLKELGFSFPESSANFIFAKHESLGGEEIYQKLKKRKILVRHFSLEEIKDYNRITIGTKEQMDILISALAEILEEK